MIRQLRGMVLKTDMLGATVDVMGLGIFVRLPNPDAVLVGKEVVLLTHLAVKKDGLEMYGFTDAADLAFFELLINVPNVGPKTALSILKRAPREQLEGAIAKRDITHLTRVVGLGKKTAEKIVVELADKIGANAQEHDGDDTEVFDTLVALGYTEREARKALAALPENISGKEARLRAALGNR